MKNIVLKFVILLLVGIFSSCANLKEYEKAKLNDKDMLLSTRPTDQFVSNFHSYREGAAGANGGKTGGGCGCN